MPVRAQVVMPTWFWVTVLPSTVLSEASSETITPPLPFRVILFLVCRPGLEARDPKVSLRDIATAHLREVMERSDALVRRDLKGDA